MATAYRAQVCLSCAALVERSSCTCPPARRCRIFFSDRLNLRLGVPEECGVASPPLYHPFSSVKKREKDRNTGKAFCAHSDIPEVVTANSWKVSVLHSNLPVLVEFWAAWCGPCRMVDRVIDEIAQDYDGRIKCFKLNADKYPQIAADHGIERVPTVLLFKDGKKLKSITGTMPKFVYVTAIEKSFTS